MKKLVVAVIVMFFSISGFSRKLNASKVPQAVKDGFKKAYPNDKATWEREDGNYEANFLSDGRPVSLILNKEGIVLETETTISLSELPSAARDYIEKHYKNKKLKEVAKIEKASHETMYEVVIPGKELIFDAAGNFKETEKTKD
jgi:hypothetical protein